MDDRTEHSSLHQLHQEVGVYALAAALFLLGGFGVLSANLGLRSAALWLALSGGLAVYQFASLWKHLPENRLKPASQQHDLLPGLGHANQITVARGVLTAALAGFLLLHWPRGWLAWAPGVLYLLVVLLDILDGYVARVTRRTTLLGERLDMQWDGAGMVIAVILLVRYGQAPLPYLLVGLARYLFVLGLWDRRRRNLPVYDLPPSRIRRALASTQMGFVAVILLPLFTPPITHVAAVLFMLPILIGFLRDWLSVSGQIRPAPAPGGAEAVTLRGRLEAALPLVMRAALLALLGSIVAEQFGKITPALGILLISLLAIPALLLGAAGRSAALVLMLMAGFGLQVTPLDGRYWLILLFSMLLFMIGTGKLSIWKPEERLIYHRAEE